MRTVTIHHTVPAVIRRTRQFRHGDVFTLNHTGTQLLSTRWRTIADAVLSPFESIGQQTAGIGRCSHIRVSAARWRHAAAWSYNHLNDTECLQRHALTRAEAADQPVPAVRLATERRESDGRFARR